MNPTYTEGQLTEAEKAKLYEEMRRKSREYQERYRANPIRKKIASINQMIHIARKKGNWQRVAELEERRRQLKEDIGNDAIK